jgi:hypothetical protein
MKPNRARNFFQPAFFFSLLFVAANLPAQEKPALSPADRIRLAEAFRLAEMLGDEVWHGWSNAPFATLLITPEYEFLLRHPKPTDDFTFIGYDSLLQSSVYFRQRVFQPNLLATFPAVNGIVTIVIGQPENTDAKNSGHWVMTLLHEHFHQLQMSQPNYFTDVNGLGLARGDETGMWMLNYPFPYDSVEVKKRFADLAHALSEALQAANTPEFKNKLSAYRQARQHFRQSLCDDDYNYFSFQLWQEGAARYTEYRMAELAAAKYQPSEEFKSLIDFISFEQEAKATTE